MNVRTLERQAKTINHTGSYLRFKHAVLGVNEHATAQEKRLSGVRRTVGATDYFSGNNMIAGYKYFQAMPASNDKASLLRHGFRLANQSGSHKGITLGVSILAAHPFADGNGRTARLIHATHVGHSVEQIIESGLFTPHDADGRDAEARKFIDLRPPKALADYAESEIYRSARLSREPFRPVLYDEHIPRTIDIDTYMAEQENETNQLHSCLRFGLNALHASGYTIPVAYETEDVENPGTILKTVDFTNFMSGLSGRGLHTFLAKTREYRKLRAKTWIDCTSHSTTIGNQRLTLEPGNTKTVAAHFLDLTNNLHRRPLPTKEPKASSLGK